MHKLLLDENLSPWAAVELRASGFDVVHVRDRGVLGDSDSAVFAKAHDEDRILVTANVGDFRRLASGVEVHAGLILIEDGFLARREQLEVLKRVLVALTGEPDMVNRALTVSIAGGLAIEELPPE